MKARSLASVESLSFLGDFFLVVLVDTRFRPFVPRRVGVRVAIRSYFTPVRRDHQSFRAQPRAERANRYSPDPTTRSIHRTRSPMTSVRLVSLTSSWRAPG